jgi:hypothetical protein
LFVKGTICFERVGGIEVVKRSVKIKCYDSVWSMFDLWRYRLVWAQPKTHATSAILYLIKLVSYDFTLKPPCFYDNNEKPLERAFLQYLG